MGRAVTGNLRSFVFACNNINESESVGYPELTKCLLFLSADYFWPLLEEVAPKLGSYEILVNPAQSIAQFIFINCAKKESSYCLIHRDVIQKQSKIFEILEYAGFFSRREASRALKSGGRGVVLSANLCNLLEVTPGNRLTSELATQWLDGSDEPFELHVMNPDYNRIAIPEIGSDADLTIFSKGISTLQRSNAYPYGLTFDKVWRLENNGYTTIQDVAEADDEAILSIYMIGPRSLKRIRDVIYQAIWM
ncbi:hypothetical protein QO058_17665 [Bosea vestrisii]|uniref:hypothetical protein n=1 Tax=Bosea vestrisii TaxID=151416 RepID=UPI0024DF7E78|nr:hypothetical protein [Bosea vestrisii]WID94653.1 hypothetical protein QO058_17665 [Bosea vestrisii]